MSSTTFRFQGFHHTILIVALVAEDNTPFSKEVSFTLGTKREDTILEVLKEGEIEVLDSVWKRVKNNRSLSKLREEVGI